MNFYDKVEAKSVELAGLVSLTLGLILLCGSCWVLDGTIRSESLVYYSYGVRVGGLRLDTPSHNEAYGFLSSLLTPSVTVLKTSAAFGILTGGLQMGSTPLAIKRSVVGLRVWWGLSVVAFLLSLTTLLLPLTHRLMHSLETKILVTLASLNALMLLHLLSIVALQMRTNEDPEKEAEAPHAPPNSKRTSALTMSLTPSENSVSIETSRRNQPSSASSPVQSIAV